MATSSFKTAYTAAPELDDYEAKKLPTYEAQTDKVEQTYSAKQDADIAALKGAYDTSLLQSEADMAKIPGVYQAQANAIDGQAAKQRQAWNEYANANGLNSGAGGQAQLALGNQLQGDLSAVRAGQANATANAQLEITKLKTQYQDNVAAAVKQNDYEKAAALLAEYQNAAQSIVSVAQAQADEDYRAYQSGVSNAQYTAEWNKSNEDEQRKQAQGMIDQALASGFSAKYITDSMGSALAASGYSVPYLNSMASYYYYQNKSSGSSGSSGSSSSRGWTEPTAASAETAQDDGLAKRSGVTFGGLVKKSNN